MMSILKDLSLPAASIVFIICAIAVLKYLLPLLGNLRSNAAEIVLEKELSEIDTRIEKFYLPLRERFILTKLIAQTSSKWIENGEYKNSTLNIISNNQRALRDIVVLKILLPLNSEIENVILNKFHWKHPDDQTNYALILQHYVFWRTFENSRSNGEIEKYDGSRLLTFPKEQVESHFKMCDLLLEEREKIRAKIKNFRSFVNN